MITSAEANLKEDMTMWAVIFISMFFVLLVATLDFEANLKFTIIFGFFLLTSLLALIVTTLFPKNPYIAKIAAGSPSERDEFGMGFISQKAMITLSVVLFFVVLYFTSVGKPLFNMVANAPSFATTGFSQSVVGLEGLINKEFINAFTTAFAGIPETAFFFVILFPSIILILTNFVPFFQNNRWMSIIGAIIISSLIFMIFHLAVYGANSVALMSVFTFGLINCILLILFKSAWLLIALHVANNLALTNWFQGIVVSLGNIAPYLFLVVVIGVVVIGAGSLFFNNKSERGFR